MTTTRPRHYSHCQECGHSADAFATDGYSTCCNELISPAGCDDTCYHDAIIADEAKPTKKAKGPFSGAAIIAATQAAPAPRKSGSHAACDHEATKSARAACRKARAAN